MTTDYTPETLLPALAKWIKNNPFTLTASHQAILYQIAAHTGPGGFINYDAKDIAAYTSASRGTVMSALHYADMFGLMRVQRAGKRMMLRGSTWAPLNSDVWSETEETQE